MSAFAEWRQARFQAALGSPNADEIQIGFCPWDVLFMPRNARKYRNMPGTQSGKPVGAKAHFYRTWHSAEWTIRVCVTGGALSIDF